MFSTSWRKPICRQRKKNYRAKKKSPVGIVKPGASAPQDPVEFLPFLNITGLFSSFYLTRYHFISPKSLLNKANSNLLYVTYKQRKSHQQTKLTKTKKQTNKNLVSDHLVSFKKRQTLTLTLSFAQALQNVSSKYQYGCFVCISLPLSLTLIQELTFLLQPTTKQKQTNLRGRF